LAADHTHGNQIEIRYMTTDTDQQNQVSILYIKYKAD